MTEQRIKELRGLCKEFRRRNGPLYIAATRHAIPELLDEVDRLTAENASIRAWADACQDQMRPDGETIKRLLDENEKLAAELAAMTRERDAAVKDMRRLAHGGEGCEVCKQFIDNGKCCADCDDCELECYCRTCRNSNKWEWRGPVAAEGET